MHARPWRDGTDFSVVQCPPLGLPGSLRTVCGKAGKELPPICFCHLAFSWEAGVGREEHRLGKHSQSRLGCRHRLLVILREAKRVQLWTTFKTP